MKKRGGWKKYIVTALISCDLPKNFEEVEKLGMNVPHAKTIINSYKNLKSRRLNSELPNSNRKIKQKLFSILKNQKIIIKENQKHWEIRIVCFCFFTFSLAYKEAKKGFSKGGIAHELLYIYIFEKQGFLKAPWFTNIQHFSYKDKRKVERSVGILVIKKCYGKELHNLRKKVFSRSQKEVKEILKKYCLLKIPLSEILNPKNGTK